MKEYTTKVDSLSEKESIRSEEEQSASETKPIVFGMVVVVDDDDVLVFSQKKTLPYIDPN